MLSLGLGMGLTEPSVSGGSGGGGVTPLTQPLYVAAGDSITANGGSLSATVANTSGRGYWCWAAQNLRHKLRPAYQVNAGISGNQANQLLARYATDVTAKNPKIVFLLIGTNDIVTGGRTAAAILADIDSMIAANRAIGAITVLGKILPRGSVASPMTADQISRWVATNTGIAARAAADVIVWDAESVFGNNDANHTVPDNVTTSNDRLHPNTRGAQIIGEVVSTALANAGLLVDVDPLFTTDNAVGNLVPAGFLTGTAGAKSNGATGDVATGWTANGGSRGGADFSCQKVARLDGFGEWQQITVGGTYTGSTRNCNINRSVSSLTVASGNKLQIACEFELDSGHSALSSISLVCTFNGGTFSCESLSPFASEPNGPAGGYTGLIKTQPLHVNAGVTSLQCFMRVNMKDTAGTDPVSIVARFGRVEVRDLGATVT
jgi:lysophospholipase L1-like esterase